MKRKAERLRVVLAVGTVALLLVLVGTMGYARYRAGKAWLKRAKERSGVSLVRETDGFTYSQSVQGKTIFTLHASKAFQHVDGQYTLHDVVLTLYGLREGRADRVFGNEFEWDETKGIARAVGPVQMDLQVPPGVASAERRGGASAATAAAGGEDSVHVMTSGLVFVRQLGVAATQEPITFKYGGMQCVARGAEFDSSPSALHLLADVHAEGEVRGQKVDLRAASADFRRDTNVLALAQVVLAGGAGQSVRGKDAVLQLRPDGSVEKASLTGGVEMVEVSHGAGTRTATVRAARMDAMMSGKNQPEKAKLSGGVTMVSADARQKVQGEAKVVEVMFDGKAEPSKMVATGGAHFASESGGAAGGHVSRDVRGERLTAMFVSAGPKGKAVLHDVLVDGSAQAGSVASAGAKAGTTVTSIGAESLRAMVVMDGGRPGVETVYGQGRVLLRQLAPGGVERTSAADTMEVHLAGRAAGGGADAVTFAREDGHVQLATREPAKAGSKVRGDAVGRAGAEHAAYDGAANVVTLTGGAQLEDAGRSVRAATVRLEQTSGDAQADGSVVATLVGAGGVGTHVTAEHATLHKASGVAEFAGGAGGKAKLWQGASQVEAAVIVADRAAKTLVARAAGGGGVVESVFAQTPAKAGEKTEDGKKERGAGYAVRVQSRELKFLDAEQRAVFTGPVVVDGATGKVQGDGAVATFTPKSGAVKSDSTSGAGVNFGASVLERVVVLGKVTLQEGGRTGSGGELSYKANDGSFTLTGTATQPATMHDAQQGTVTGASLLFRAGDSTIVVAGAGVNAPAAGKRARIDTRLRQKAQ